MVIENTAGNPPGRRPNRMRRFGRWGWKWIFRVAMLSSIGTMVLTLVLVLQVLK